MINNLSIVIHALNQRILTSLSDAVAEVRELVYEFQMTANKNGVGPFSIKTCISFCLRSRGDQCLLLPTADYTAELWLGLVNSQEALCNLYSLCPL